MKKKLLTLRSLLNVNENLFEKNDNETESVLMFYEIVCRVFLNILKNFFEFKMKPERFFDKILPTHLIKFYLIPRYNFSTLILTTLILQMDENY